MSEPLSSVEIEDVLSSIRRLVSEDLRPAPRPQPEPARPALILTPALRVVMADDPLSEVAQGQNATLAEARDDGFAPADPEPSDVQDSGQADAWSEPGGDPEPQHPAFQDEDLSPTDRAPPVERVLVDHVLVDQSLADENHADQRSDTAWADAAEAEVIAALEHPALEHPAPRPAAARLHLTEDPPEMSFDEEVLRDLVRDLIREELQGHLGERITRNVRKLVRAEIARALAAAEFD